MYSSSKKNETNKIPCIGISPRQTYTFGKPSGFLVARVRRILVSAANPWAAVEFLPGFSTLEERVCILQLQQEHPLEPAAAFIL